MTTRAKRSKKPMAEPRETFEHSIEVELTDEDVAAVEKRVAQIDREVAAIVKKQAGTNAIYKQQKDTLLREREPLLKRSDTRKSKVEVECYHQRDVAGARMLTLRCDTDEVVDERALTAEEREADRQGGLFGGDSDEEESS